MDLQLGYMCVNPTILLENAISLSIVQHVVSSPEHNTDPVTFTSAAFNQLRLNQLDPDIFPIPKFSLIHPKSIESEFSIIPEIRLLKLPIFSHS
jgi:hypothetical protein